jgi:putative membrane protein insertion efficiency factor
MRDAGKLVVLRLLRAYKWAISPMFPPACRYVPTCSEYAMEAVERYGALRGGLMALWRLLRCHPFAHGGYDPVVKVGAGATKLPQGLKTCDIADDLTQRQKLCATRNPGPIDLDCATQNPRASNLVAGAQNSKASDLNSGTQDPSLSNLNGAALTCGTI